MKTNNNRSYVPKYLSFIVNVSFNIISQINYWFPYVNKLLCLSVAIIDKCLIDFDISFHKLKDSNCYLNKGYFFYD